ncbi:hypothetical protein MAR_011189 [Mya arenaria]|uniref:Uncharacterized protein n=1 Tax=Mya arenaria TaxID=6604 RepID=A0ABY7FU09_MYAAR|nr:hypothetical protein MAR_011189 [Mya arenaria]
MAQRITWSFFLLVGFAAVHQSLSLSNVEFYEKLKPYLELESIMRNSSAVDVAEEELETVANDGSDVILLPGGPDDELDIAFLLKELGFTPGNASESAVDPEIASLLDAFNLAPRKVCIRVDYRSYSSYLLSFTLNGYRLLYTYNCRKYRYRHRSTTNCRKYRYRHHSTTNCRKYRYRHRSTKNCHKYPYRHHTTTNCRKNRNRHHSDTNYLGRSTYQYCYHVHHLVSPSSRLCAQLYSINRSRRTMCARITGTVNIKGHVHSAYQNIGCFRIPCHTDNQAIERQEGTDDLPSDDFDPASDDVDSGSDEKNENQDGSFEDSAEDDSDSAERYE